MKIGVLHPGEMGASIGAALHESGHEVFYVAIGRSSATRKRAAKAGLEDAGSLQAMLEKIEVLFSICPPSAALEVASTVMKTGFNGVYVDANAIAPSTALQIAALVPNYVDGGVIGAPIQEKSQTRLYLSGQAAPMIAGLFADSILETRVLGEVSQAASTLKMAYAAWSKGSAALLLNSMALARASGVEEALIQEWRDSSPELIPRIERAAKSSAKKGWRWIGEMNEIALSMQAHELPNGFHDAAAEVFTRLQDFKNSKAELETVLDALIRHK